MTVTNHLKNDRFLKRSLFKMSGSFLKRSFFSKTKQSFLKTIEKRNKKQSFNDRFQKWLTTLPIAGNHRLSLLVHHSSLHHHSLWSIHLKLLSSWVESTHPFAARVVDSRPYVFLHPSGGHNCLTRCRLRMFLKQEVCVVLILIFAILILIFSTKEWMFFPIYFQEVCFFISLEW